MSNEEFFRMLIPRLIPIIAFIAIALSKASKKNKYAKPRTSKQNALSKNAQALRGGAAQPAMTTTEPKPWQVGKHNVTKKNTYKSAFEKRGAFSGGTVSAFGDSRDVVSSGSMAASNAAYMDVGNDYVSSFEVGGHRETPIGFDR